MQVNWVINGISRLNWTEEHYVSKIHTYLVCTEYCKFKTLIVNTTWFYMSKWIILLLFAGYGV